MAEPVPMPSIGSHADTGPALRSNLPRGFSRSTDPKGGTPNNSRVDASGTTGVVTFHVGRHTPLPFACRRRGGVDDDFALRPYALTRRAHLRLFP